MPDTAQNETTWFRISRDELTGTIEAVRHYHRALMSEGDTHGQAGIRAFRRANGEHGYLWDSFWHGKNHQKIQVGDTVRRQSVDDEPEFVEATVLTVTTYAALLDDEVSGVGWEVWPLIHRLDRLHTEPTFDFRHYVPISQHMGYEITPGDIEAYKEFLAEHGVARPTLSIVKGGGADVMAGRDVGADGGPDAEG